MRPHSTPRRTAGVFHARAHLAGVAAESMRSPPEREHAGGTKTHPARIVGRRRHGGPLRAARAGAGFDHPGFPRGTLVVNAAGCLLFGRVWCLGEERLVISGKTRLIILVGFLGSFTTFSSFAFETGQLLRDFQRWLAAGNATPTIS